jgi:hypothetical protein
VGRGLLVTVPHVPLVEPGIQHGTPVIFAIPAANGRVFGAFQPGVSRDQFGKIRPAPAYAHARTPLRNGRRIDLNNDAAHSNVLDTVSTGKYEASHYFVFPVLRLIWFPVGWGFAPLSSATGNMGLSADGLMPLLRACRTP